MAQTVIVHERVCEKHGELTNEGVLMAWNNRVRCQMRVGPWPPQYVAIGFDDKGRALQMVASYDPLQNSVLIFHAMSLTAAVRRELGID